uniref:Septin 7 n=1 Tax=Molossus molossus TaxID=27622 RepID=A0A7J8I021_MOLMO|nr:hypothetical protein HJG59_010846 [Molossus molossus]
MQDLKGITNNVHYENYRRRKLAAVTYDTVEVMSPLAQMEEKRREHVAEMKKVETEQVFEMKVKEKVQKLKDSEAELQQRHEQMKKNLQAQHKELEENMNLGKEQEEREDLLKPPLTTSYVVAYMSAWTSVFVGSI